MLFSLTRVLLYLFVTCVFVGATLYATFVIEQEHGQMGMAYTGMFLMYCIILMPLNGVIGGVTDFFWKHENKNLLIVPVLLAITASCLFLKTGLGHEIYFTSDRNKPPLLIGRSLEFFNPKPQTQFSNVNTYFPLIVMTTFFLPFAIWPLFDGIGAFADHKHRRTKK